MITLSDILAAQKVIRPHLWHTPVVASPSLSRLSGNAVYLKLECWQRTGSFKARGALTKLASLTAADWERGVVTASAGNHGLGLAYASQVLGLPPVTIFVPDSAPSSKIDGLCMTSCSLRRAGSDYDACHSRAVDYAQETGALYVSAYDDPLLIAGQATVGLEIMSDRPDVDLLLVPVGGGGLIAGTAIVAKTINPRVRIIGLQPEASPSAYHSLRDGRPYETYAAGPTICDGLAGGFGRIPFELAASLIDDILIVPEEDVRQAVAWLLMHEQLVVEGSGAIAIAPLLSGQMEAEGRNVVTILTGRNIDVSLLQTILTQFIHPGP